MSACDQDLMLFAVYSYRNPRFKQRDCDFAIISNLVSQPTLWRFEVA